MPHHLSPGCLQGSGQPPELRLGHARVSVHGRMWCACRSDRCARPCRVFAHNLPPHSGSFGARRIRIRWADDPYPASCTHTSPQAMLNVCARVCQRRGQLKRLPLNPRPPPSGPVRQDLRVSRAGGTGGGPQRALRSKQPTPARHSMAPGMRSGAVYVPCKSHRISSHSSLMPNCRPGPQKWVS